MRFLWAAAFALVLAGCVATGPYYEDPPGPPEGYAQIIVYRTPALAAGAHSVSLTIDGTPLAALNVNGYTTVLLRPGVHQIGRIRDAKIAAGLKYFYRYSTGAGVFEILPGVAGGEFTLVAEETAKRELTEYHFQPAKIDKQNWNTAD